MHDMARLSTARRTTAAAMLLTGTLALAACGSDEPTADTASEGPLTEFFADVYGDYDEDQAQAEQMEIEEAVARCMVDEGFEYKPVDQSAMSYSSSPMDEDPEEYAAEYGYGFSVPMEPSAEEQAAMDEWVDPNQEYVEAMSEAEQTAYYAALYGDQAFMEYDEDAEMPEYDPATAGCQGAADLEVRGDQNALYESEEMLAFNEATTQLYEDVAADPRLGEADAAWAGCMADAGFAEYSTPQEAMDAMMEQSNALWEGGEPEGPSEEKLAEAQEIERDTAVADHACQQEVDYEKVQLEVQHELEAAFVEEHRDQMEAVRDLMTEAQQ
jgi:hypothetical protein